MTEAGAACWDVDPQVKSHTPSLVPRHPFSCRTHFSIAALFPTAQNSMCLKHHVGSSNDSGIEHERPRVHGNELSVEEIAGQVNFISRLHFSGVKTREIHKSLQAPGKRLGEEGKTKVSGRGCRWRIFSMDQDRIQT